MIVTPQQDRKDCVERLAKEFIRAYYGSTRGVRDLPVLAMALADKAYSAGIEISARRAEEFSHFDDGPEAQIKRYIAERIRRT